MEPRFALIYISVAVFGLLQLLLARWLAGKSRDLLRRGKRAPGRLIGVAPRARGGGRSRHDLVEFTTDDGRRGEATSRIGVPWSPLAGKTITVLYDPDDLEHAVIEGRFELWAAPVLFASNGGLMFLAAIVIASLHIAGVISPGQ